jgi:non-heme chloroperoxidase
MYHHEIGGTLVTTTNDGVKLAYQVHGDGPRTVIAVHGWMVSSRVYDGLIAALDRTGLRLVVPDLRGAGDSDKPATGYTIERYARDILHLADELGARSFTLIGHSMGGTICQWIAAHAPERVQGMVLLCPVPASGVPFPPDAAGLFRNAHTAEAHTAILGMACTNLSDAGRTHLLAAAATVPAACIAEAFDAWVGASFADKLGAITAPTLVVATDDPFLPPDFLRQAVVAPISGARLAVLHGAGHYVPVERTDETAAIVEGFLAGLGRVL